MIIALRSRSALRGRRRCLWPCLRPEWCCGLTTALRGSADSVDAFFHSANDCEAIQIERVPTTKRRRKKRAKTGCSADLYLSGDENQDELGYHPMIIVFIPIGSFNTNVVKLLKLYYFGVGKKLEKDG